MDRWEEPEEMIGEQERDWTTGSGAQTVVVVVVCHV